MWFICTFSELFEYQKILRNMMQFKGKNAPACTWRVEECNQTINYIVLGLKNLYLKSEVHNCLFDKAQKWPILTL